MSQSSLSSWAISSDGPANIWEYWLVNKTRLLILRSQEKTQEKRVQISSASPLSANRFVVYSHDIKIFTELFIVGATDTSSSTAAVGHAQRCPLWSGVWHLLHAGPESLLWILPLVLCISQYALLLDPAEPWPTALHHLHQGHKTNQRLHSPTTPNLPVWLLLGDDTNLPRNGELRRGGEAVWCLYPRCLPGSWETILADPERAAQSRCRVQEWGWGI